MADYQKNMRKFRKFLSKATRVLSPVVVFIVTYLLVLPAITLSNDSDLSGIGHVHSRDCYERILVCEKQENDSSSYDPVYLREEICGLKEHVHGEDCYSDGGELLCEIKEHVHDENCYISYDSLKIAETHRHDENCYRKILSCGKEGYTLFTGEANGVAVKAYVPDGSFEKEVVMRVSPVYEEEIIDAVNEVMEDAQSLVALDISFLDEERKECEPLKPLKVTLSGSSLDGEEEKTLLHIDEQGSAEVVESNSDQNGIAFESDSFSTYVVVTTIEKVVLSSDGNNYKISVSYTPEAKVPDNASLLVEEILSDASLSDECNDYERYLAKTRELLNYDSGAFAYARFFDISIVDENGQKVEVAASVDVKIELADRKSAFDDLTVIHFEGEQEKGELVDNLKPQDDALNFTTDGFSAYAIVQGPAPLPMGWDKIASIQDLFEKGTEGLYIGNPNGFYFTGSLTDDGKRVGITKTTPAADYPGGNAVLYYFEAAGSNSFYAYCLDENQQKKYVYNNGNNSLSLTDEEHKTLFEVVLVSDNTFRVHNGAWYWNMQGGIPGSRFCSYNNANDVNDNLNFWFRSEEVEDPYNLNDKSYGLMFYDEGVAGKALMGQGSDGSLDAKVLSVMSKTGDNTDRLFVPNDADISFWSFEWDSDDYYYLSTVVDGSRKFLKISADGLFLVSDRNEASKVRVMPGSGIHSGQICFRDGNNVLSFSGTAADGFGVNGSVGKEWLYFVDRSELTSDYFLTYSAQKVSVSDPSIGNGSRVIVYTRYWNDEKKRYDYFAIDHDGTLIPVYESGDIIEWNSSQINTLLWNFVEYYWQGTTDPNYYYELYNQYSEKYIAPQVSDGQILSDKPIGINMDGRRDGRYYSDILAWDQEYFSYVGLKVEEVGGVKKIVSCDRDEAMDFYFAIMQDLNVDDDLTLVPTVDHTQYGITMKMIDFDTRKEMSDFLGNDAGGVGTQLHQGLLSSELQDNGYPLAAGGSLSQLFAAANERTVNHLFIKSNYEETGYFEYNSTQNFASLKDDNNFVVYKQIGTHDQSSRETLKHGQFFPFNDLKAGTFASFNGKNLYSLSSSGATVDPLPESDPRKYENLYNIEHDGQKTDYYFGMELEASFTQTPSGLDAWGHDIIFEFTGDDDFWLYVDNELVIDLGGIHSATAGKVNFSTGEVIVNGADTTLYQLFYDNYLGRGHSQAEAQAYVDGLFELNDEGNYVFEDYTSHTMRVFYMERGAGASNLHMRFNLAAVKEGTVELNKKLDGVDDYESVMAEFAYQVYYKLSNEEGAPEYLLSNMVPKDPLRDKDYVFYKDSIKPVKYARDIEIDGLTYEDVFFLKPDETAQISFPEGMVSYRIVECGVDTAVYDRVEVNAESIEGRQRGENRSDFEIPYASDRDRPRVGYVNHVDPDALRSLNIVKHLYNEDGSMLIEDDSSTFTFRLYLSSEFDELDLANKHTYHVKDSDGYYCRWDVAAQRFVKIEPGYIDFDQLPDKKAASFTTSIYGTVDRVPVGYTLEFRDLLAGTRFRVVERPSEIPDGYSFRSYSYNYEPEREYDSAWDGVEDLIVNRNVNPEDPEVIVNNLKGWGLRVNKSWSDSRFMAQREPIFLAVYVKSGEQEDLLPYSVKQLAFDEDPQSVYWYYDVLPVAGSSLSDYVLREVRLEGDYEVDEDGTVSAYSQVLPVMDGATVSLSGMQIGESEESLYHYTVTYTTGEQDDNVRCDEILNVRPGIILKKTAWDFETPLKDAQFVLEDQDGNVIGEFVSDEEGLIAIAFLSEDKEYLLKEVRSPLSYQGNEETLKLKFSGGILYVNDETTDGLWYRIEQAQNDQLSCLTLRNRPFAFEAVKIDPDSDPEELAGVEFALHRQVIVDGVISIDLNPMPGFEHLISDENGKIPKVDETLEPNTYELREITAIEGYELLDHYIRFTISQNGEITLADSTDEAVSLERMENEDGSISYCLLIRNFRRKNVSIWKSDSGHETLIGASFDLYRKEDYDDSRERIREGAVPICSGTVDEKGLWNLGDLPLGEYRLVETEAPDGYVMLSSAIRISVLSDRVAALQSGAASEISRKGDPYFVEGQSDETWQIRVWNSSGTVLPHTGGTGRGTYYACGALLILLSSLSLIRKKH